MSVTFKKTNQTVEVDCYQNLNLLAHAQMEELEIGSRCGGHGICGGDRIQVLVEPTKLSPITEAEREHLSLLELSQGWRLACQCWPSADGSSLIINVNGAEKN